MKYILVLAVLISCLPSKRKENKEARDDVRKMVDAFVKKTNINHRVYPVVETEPVHTSKKKDAADDPAIWVNPTNRGQSIVFGTDKKSGLSLYNLKGEELQYLPCGKMNNVDVRTINGRVLVSATNRTTNTIDIFELDTTTYKISIMKSINSHIGKVYGFTSGRIANNTLAVFSTDKNGKIEQWNVSVGLDYLEESYIKTYDSFDKTEGLVFDDQTLKLYAAVEEKGIMVFDIKNQTEKWIASSMKKNNPLIEYDIEGITLFKHNQNKYLLASVQGNFSYALFDVRSMAYITSFTIESNDNIDMVLETDGLDVVTDSLSTTFPEGILVVQDGFNYDKKLEKLQSQNFKYIDMAMILKVIDNKK